MSGLEALSLACNAMTVIDFALNTVKVCRSIRETGSSDKSLEENTKNVEQTLNNMQDVLQQQPTAPTAAEIDLRGLAAKCMEYNEAVQKELEYISPKANRGLSAVLGSTFKTVKRRSHLNDLKGHLEAAHKTLDTALAVRILEECIKSKALTSATYSTLDQQHKAFLANYKQILDTIFAEFDATRETQAYETLLNSLRYDSMNDRKNSIPERHRETFEWIFGEGQGFADPATTYSTGNSEGAATPGSKENNATLVKLPEGKATQEPKTRAGLMEWLQRDENCLYWVSGKPGSGKSTFMKFLEKDNRTKEALRRWQPQCKIISHYLWKPGTSSQQSLKGLLCSLLHQVLSLERSIAIRLLGEIQSLGYKRADTDWDIADLRELLFRGLYDSSYAYLILLDGLDELAEPHGGLNELFYLLGMLVTADRVKLCVSSRPEPSFAAKFDPNPSIRMQDLTRLDIERYTADFLSKELQLDPGNELYKKIHKKISFKAEGVFIWVYLVLSRVKIGIEKYFESWDEIYERIIKMPADLMRLYKDMWSRLDGNNEKYTKKAARYFQCARLPVYGRIGLAEIALFADDQRLEEFTRTDEVPSVDEIIKMSQITMETLFQVSAGLLQVRPIRRGPNNPGPKDVAGYNEKAHRWLYEAPVEFIHRTAIDFLESDEGKDIFDRDTLGPTECFLQCAKVDLAIRSSYHFTRNPLITTLLCMKFAFKESANMESLAACNSLLSTIHRCALNKSRGLLRPPPWILSYENFFLLEAATHGFYEYLEERIKNSEDPFSTASIYTLIGACDCSYGIDFSIKERTRFDKRYELIRDILKEYVKSSIGTLGPSAVRAARDNIMLAWRCFLLHELSFNGQKRRTGGHTQLIEEIIELFIEAGVMAESPAPRYLIAVRVLHPKSSDRELQIVKRPPNEQSMSGDGSIRPQEPTSFYPTIYVELNDAFLLRQLSQMISGTSELISTQGTNAFMKPVLLDTGVVEQGARFFHLTASDADLESSTEWIFGNKFGFDRDFILDEKPDFIQAVDLGILPHAVDALDKVGYQLSEVNRDGGYECLHEWF